jgi:hypothetical protein
MILNESLRRARMLAAVLSAGLGTACAHRGPTTSPAPAPNPAQPGAAMPASALPQMQRVRGPLDLRVAYPPPDAVLQIAIRASCSAPPAPATRG